MKILKVELSDKECHDIMTTAYEDGRSIGYWIAGARKLKRTKDLDVISFDIQTEEDAPKGQQWYTINAETIRKGVNLLLSSEFQVSSDIRKQLIGDPDDMDVDIEGADCIIQAALFGEIVYG